VFVVSNCCISQNDVTRHSIVRDGNDGENVNGVEFRSFQFVTRDSFSKRNMNVFLFAVKMSFCFVLTIYKLFGFIPLLLICL